MPVSLSSRARATRWSIAAIATGLLARNVSTKLRIGGDFGHDARLFHVGDRTDAEREDFIAALTSKMD